VAHMKPEYLLEPHDYRHWVKMSNSEHDRVGMKMRTSLDDVVFDSVVEEIMDGRAATDH